jgi:adenosylhomocysteine nucleosidase
MSANVAHQNGVLFVMAAKEEYGPALRTRITPLISGVGPVEAAIGLTRVLASLQLGPSLPRLVVSLGSAGSAKLAHTEIYQARSVSYRDMDASAPGFDRGCTPFLSLPATVPLTARLPGLPSASLSTGANVVSGTAYAAIDAEMVDMETFALLRSCQSYDIPLLAIRGISDGHTEISRLSDWTEYLAIIDLKLASVVDRIFEALADGSLPVEKSNAVLASGRDRGAAPEGIARRAGTVADAETKKGSI